jgi:methionine synthase II (cobalamin-independent)
MDAAMLSVVTDEQRRAELACDLDELVHVNPDPGLAEVLVAGQQAAQAKLEELAKASGGAAVNGWTTAVHMFDSHCCVW